MTNRNNDDVARALEALSAGEHPEETEQHADDHLGHPPAPPPIAAQPRPAAPRPVAARPAPAAPQTRAASPSAPRPAQPGAGPAARPTAPQPAQPAAQRLTTPASARPAQPSPARPVATQQRPGSPAASRPAAPPAPRSATAPGAARPAASVARPAAPIAPDPGIRADEGQVVDDDAVIVPAPDASVFLHKHASKKPKTVPFGQGLGARRTFIPILLTGGFIMFGLGLLHFIWHADNNPMGGLPPWLVALLFLFGLVLWGMAFANMMTVKHIIDARRAPGSSNLGA
jgi:hypothetical protein